MGSQTFNCLSENERSECCYKMQHILDHSPVLLMQVYVKSTHTPTYRIVLSVFITAARIFKGPSTYYIMLGRGRDGLTIFVIYTLYGTRLYKLALYNEIAILKKQGNSLFIYLEMKSYSIVQNKIMRSK